MSPLPSGPISASNERIALLNLHQALKNFFLTTYPHYNDPMLKFPWNHHVEKKKNWILRFLQVVQGLDLRDLGDYMAGDEGREGVLEYVSKPWQEGAGMWSAVRREEMLGRCVVVQEVMDQAAVWALERLEREEGRTSEVEAAAETALPKRTRTAKETQEVVVNRESNAETMTDKYPRRKKKKAPKPKEEHKEWTEEAPQKRRRLYRKVDLEPKPKTVSVKSTSSRVKTKPILSPTATTSQPENAHVPRIITGTPSPELEASAEVTEQPWSEPPTSQDVALGAVTSLPINAKTMQAFFRANVNRAEQFSQLIDALEDHSFPTQPKPTQEPTPTTTQHGGALGLSQLKVPDDGESLHRHFSKHSDTPIEDVIYIGAVPADKAHGTIYGKTLPRLQSVKGIPFYSDQGSNYTPPSGLRGNTERASKQASEPVIDPTDLYGTLRQRDVVDMVDDLFSITTTGLTASVLPQSSNAFSVTTQATESSVRDEVPQILGRLCRLRSGRIQ